MTTLANTQSKHEIRAGGLAFAFWKSGDLYQASGGTTMLNQLLTNPLDGSLNNLYLRLHDEAGIRYYPLLGARSDSSVRFAGGQGVIWEGQAEGLAYRVIFAPTNRDVWFWDVTVRGTHAAVDIVYGQDVGIADPGAVRSNEAYLSQYIDHSVYEDPAKGYVVCSRQNQPQAGAFPYLQQGSLTRAAGYSTDGFQFFGLSYKETDVPAALLQEQLPSEVYQYEFAYTALQSERTQLDGEARFVFYGLFKPDHSEAVTSLEYGAEVEAAWEDYERLLPELVRQAGEPETRVRRRAEFGRPLVSRTISEAELEARFPAGRRHQEERVDGKLVAFFTDTYEHIVLKEKEIRVERPHGHILMSGNNVELGSPVITTTSYMYGVFNSHLVVGNTNFNKMLSVARNSLNIPKTSGQRIYVEQNGELRLLTLPSVYEIGFNYVRWYYIMEDDTIIVTNFTCSDASEVRLQVRSESGKAYRYLVTSQVTMNVNEYELPFHLTREDGGLVFRADAGSISTGAYPKLEYRLRVEGASMRPGDERDLAEGVRPGDASLVTLQLQPSPEWTLIVQGQLEGETPPVLARTAEAEIEAYRDFFRGVMNGFHLSKADPAGGEALFKVNALAWWYTHNMLVHYSVPHGLEQYGGAAWGTRDVCQGPVEYFMATHKYEQVRDIIKMVYAHQYEDDGNWPQWFMFDRYFAIQQEESHGDIIVWPLKVLADYLRTTRDFSILDEQVPYTVKHSFGFTESTASVLDHAKKELDYIRSHFLHDTYLSSYGDGDWDDTLQPANAQLKQYMISSWTVALTYQTVSMLAEAVREADSAFAEELSAIAEGIRGDFNRYMLATDVIPGFVYMEDPAQPKLMLHPSENETGIHYRLLPMTRSMIGELLTPEQAESHLKLIEREFLCPDGVRLMNRPAQYAGGVSTHFKRAEQAANFGREIGLQYVHAHIRYVEAMAKLGLAEEAWNGLGVINPVGIREVVPSAELRQSNAYFSSSDGKFSTRYEAQEHFGELRSGEVAVKGGWRIYSSGPGIYMNQLISNVLGVREIGGDLVLDPVLPSGLDGMRFEFEYAGRPVTFVYRLTGAPVSEVRVNGTRMENERLSNPYRTGGVRLSRSTLMELLAAEINEIEIMA